jgi:hypothetical protein
MKSYTKAPLVSIDTIDSSLQNFDNVKTLTIRMMTMEAMGENREVYSPYKNIKTYAKAEEYVRAIDKMMNRTRNYSVPAESESSKPPSVFIESVDEVIIYTKFTPEEMADSNSEYTKVVKDLSFYRKLLSNAVLMEYITEIFEGVMNSVGLKATVTAEQVATIVSYVAAGVPQDVVPARNNVAPDQFLPQTQKEKSIITKVKSEPEV